MPETEFRWSIEHNFEEVTIPEWGMKLEPDHVHILCEDCRVTALLVRHQKEVKPPDRIITR